MDILERLEIVASTTASDHPIQTIEFEYRAAADEIRKLRAFKAYTHERLDAMGVPVEVPSPHTDAGCRIGGRMDYVEQRLRSNA